MLSLIFIVYIIHSTLHLTYFKLVDVSTVAIVMTFPMIPKTQHDKIMEI